MRFVPLHSFLVFAALAPLPLWADTVQIDLVAVTTEGVPDFRIRIDGEDVTPGDDRALPSADSRLVRILAARAKLGDRKISEVVVRIRADSRCPYRLVAFVMTALVEPSVRMAELELAITDSERVIACPLPFDVGIEPAREEEAWIEEGDRGQPDRLPITIRGGVEGAATYIVGRVETKDLAVLANRIRTFVVSCPTTPVEIAPDGDVPYGEVFRVLGICCDACVGDIWFATPR